MTNPKDFVSVQAGGVSTGELTPYIMKGCSELLTLDTAQGWTKFGNNFVCKRFANTTVAETAMFATSFANKFSNTKIGFGSVPLIDFHLHIVTKKEKKDSNLRLRPPNIRGLLLNLNRFLKKTLFFFGHAPKLTGTASIAERPSEEEIQTTQQPTPMETEREATKKSWAEQMDEEEEGEKPLTVKKRPRPEEIPDHPADVGIIEEQGIRFPRVSMDDIEIVDGVMKEPVSQSPNKQSRNARIEAGVLRSIQKCTTGKALQDLAKTIHPEDITVPILNAFLKVMQPLLQCPSCEGIGTQHHWKPFGHQNQAQLPGENPSIQFLGILPRSPHSATAKSHPQDGPLAVHPPVMDTIPKPPSSLQECKKTVRELFTSYAIEDKTNIPPALKKLMQEIQKYFTLSESHSEVVTQLCGKLAKENLIMRKREQAGGSRPEPGSYLNAAKRNGAKKPSPTLQAIAAIAKLAPALQQEQLDKLAETRRNPVTNSPLRQREPAIKRTPLNIQSVDDITNPILKSKVNSMKWTVLENLPGENRTVIRQYLRAQGVPTNSIANKRMMGNKTEIAFHGEDAQKAIDNLVMRVSRVKTVAIDIRTTYFEGDGKEEMKDRFMNNLAQDMVQAHDMAFIIASNNGKPTTIRVGSLNVRGLTNSYHECIDLLHKYNLHFLGLQETFLPLESRIFGYENYVPFDTRTPMDARSGLTRRGISIMRNPATTSAEDFTLIEKDPEGDFIWFRFKGVIRIGVFYIPPNLKRSRHYRKKLVSIRRMHHMFPAEPSMILGDFNTRLGNPHNGDLRGSAEWQKTAFIDGLGKATLN
ncbi:hypothetical protein BC829DRAFT_423757 [Chytridium lagenaria]|nr:hypothetical protein BC829DRAFT_423757 [Chytridium lagenaria]